MTRDRRTKPALVLLVIACLTVCALVLPGGAAAAKRHPKPSAVQNVSSANQLVSKIAKSKFARGKRGQVLASGRKAVRLARGKKTCPALAAADSLLSSLRAPTTWKQKRVPAGAIRKPTGQLGRAIGALLRRSGGKCARAAKVKKLVPRVGGSGSAKVAPPNIPPEQGDGLDKKIPAGKLIPPKGIGGTAGLGPDPHGIGSPARDPFGRIASDTFSFFRNSDVGVPPRQASPMEPTAAIAPGWGVAWYTGNTSDALSVDNGRTWARFDPSNVLPDQGNAYCCDQLVSYSPSYNLFVWVSQYWCNTGGCFTTNSAGKTVCRSDGAFNRIRIAVASPAALKANAANPGRAWTFWDVTPGLIGQPANAWFDRSDMSVNTMNMNWGVDILCGNASTLVSRISLAQLAARGTVSLNFTTATGVRTTAQGQGNTTYFVGNNSLSQAQVWSWGPYSGTLFRHDINHSSVPINDIAITGSDGGNWYDRFGIFPGEVESATVSGNTLYAAQGTGRQLCTANCSTDHKTLTHIVDQPSVFVTKFDVNSWHNVGERWLWNPTLAFGWPALSTDGAGDVGVAFRTSNDHHNAQPVAGFLTPSEQFFFADPEGRPYETGDYYTLRPGRTDRSFVMTSQTVQNDPGGAAMHWFYVEYGLGTPPYVSPPDVHITAPSNLSSFTQGTSAGYSASVSDPIDGSLPSGAIRWSEDGTFIGSGASISHVESSLGTHVITVSATNGDGKSASDSITIRVNPPPSQLHVAITSPPDGSVYHPSQRPDGQYCQDVAFTSTVTGGQGPLTFSWTDIRTLDFNPPQPSQQVSTVQNPTLTLCGGTQSSSGSTHDLTLTVSDGVHTTPAQIRVTVFDPPIG